MRNLKQKKNNYVNKHPYSFEYKKKNEKGFWYGGKYTGEWPFGIIRILYGYGHRKPLFPLRGLPGDVTRIVLDDYLLNKTYIHNPTWITANEFLECKEMAYRLFREDYQQEMLKNYDLLYSYLNDHEKGSEPCRLIIWIDQG